MSVPRNINAEVQQLENVYLYNIDDLEAIVRENLCSRAQDLAVCNRLIAARATALIEKLNSGNQRLYEAGLQIPSGWVSHGVEAVA
jgi:glutamyl-tRNA reductase